MITNLPQLNDPVHDLKQYFENEFENVKVMKVNPIFEMTDIDMLIDEEHKLVK